MIEKAFFLTNRFFNLYHFESLIASDAKLIALLTPEMVVSSEAHLHHFSKVYVINSVTAGLNSRMDYAYLKSIVSQEIKGTDPTQIRLICNDDVHMPLAGKLRDDLGIPGDSEQTCLNFSDKLQAKAILRNTKIKVPGFEEFSFHQWRANGSAYFEKLSAKYSLPFVVKPTNCASSLGFKVIHSHSDFITLPILEAQEWEVEEFLYGTLFHCDSLIKDGEILFSACSQYNRPMGEFLQGAPIGSLIVPDEAEIAKKIKAFAKQILNTLGLKNGASHIEIFEHQGGLTFLEGAMRCPGGLAIPAYEKMYGLDILDNDFRIQLGLEPKLPTLAQTHAFWMMFPRYHGEVESLVAPALNSQFDIRWICAPGDKHANSISLGETVAILVGWNSDYIQAKADFKNLEQLKLVQLKS